MRRRCLQRRFAADTSVNIVKYPAAVAKRAAYKHAHLFMLGMFIFLLIAVLSKSLSFETSKTFKLFMVIYNIGLSLTAVMFIVRGVLQAMETSLSKGLDASISGIAGIGHICLGVGLVLLFVSIIGAVKEEPNE